MSNAPDDGFHVLESPIEAGRRAVEKFARERIEQVRRLSPLSGRRWCALFGDAASCGSLVFDASMEQDWGDPLGFIGEKC